LLFHISQVVSVTVASTVRESPDESPEEPPATWTFVEMYPSVRSIVHVSVIAAGVNDLVADAVVVER
jgi:hypothetical protein